LQFDDDEVATRAQLDLAERYVVTSAERFPEKEDIIFNPLTKWLLETILLDSNGRRAMAERFKDVCSRGERCKRRVICLVNLLGYHGKHADTHFVVWQVI